MTKHWKKFIAMFALSWLAGAAAIAVYLYRTSIEDFTLPDLIPMWTVLAVVGLLISALGSMPLLLTLRRRLGAAEKRLVYPLANSAMVTSAIAAAAYSLAFAARNLSVEEAGLFTVAFLALSLTFGLLFTGFYRAGEKRD